MKWILVIIFFMFPFFCVANNGNKGIPNADNNISVTTNVPLNFIISSPNDLENDMVIQNAITISVTSKSTACNIYARITSFNTPPGVYSTSGLLALDWTSDNSNKDYNLIPGETLLTTNDIELFDQHKHPHTFDYNYNLILKAPGYNFVEGNYSFTIQFTMTQP